MNKLIWRLRKIPFFFYFFLTRKLTLNRLHKFKSQNTFKLFKVLKKSIANKNSKNEITEIDKIEAVRESWIDSNTEIKIWRDEKKFEKVNRLAKVSSKSKFWANLIFNIVREFKPIKCLEIGTCIGISSSYIASALKLNEKGNLTTLEGSPGRLTIAQENFDKIGLNNIRTIVGNFDKTLDTILKETQKYNFVFIDGNHSYKATITYFSKLLPHLSDNSIIIVDDTNYSKAMNKAWNTIINNETVEIYIELFILGLVVINKKIKKKTKYSIGILRP